MNPRHPSEDEIFERAAQLADAARSAYLAEACGGDAPLRQRIERLLHAHEQAGNSFMDQPAAPSPATLVITTSMIPVIEKAGDRIGRYKLLQQIGEGGCGVVYMAEQEEPVRRRVALKVIKLGMDTKSVIARFEAERQALALMDHPHIAKVLDAGATETGRPFFVMELVRGIRITDYCDQNNLSTAQRLDLFVQVCQAIQHAHQKGIIHRDIKPSNVLVADHDGVPVPKVIDFGIAKATTLTDKTLFTAFEQFLGTPAYMSPEQAKLSGLDIDTRSDIYSLGVLLYELLTGQTPFDAATLLQAGLDQMRRIIREEEPPRPSTRLNSMAAADLTTVSDCRRAEPLKLVNLIRGDLDWIVMKALEKDRTRRYETVNGFAQDVQRHLTSEPVVARPPSQLYRLQKLIQRNKFAFSVFTAIAVMTTVGLSVAISLLRKEAQARERAIAAEKAQNQLRQDIELEQLKSQARDLDAERAEAKCREVLAITRKLFGNEHPAVASALEHLAINLQTQHANYLFGQPDNPYSLTGVLRRQHGQYLLGQSDKLTEAESLLREALTIRRRLSGNESSDTANSIQLLALTLYGQNKLAETESLSREELAIWRKLPSNEIGIHSALGDLAYVLCKQDKLPEAEALYREALTIAREHFSEEDVANDLDNLADVLERQNKAAEAESLYRESLNIQRQQADENDERVDRLVAALRQQGKYADAEAILRQALLLRRILFGEQHLRVAYSLRKLASLIDEQGKKTETDDPHREALAIEGRHLREGDTNLIRHVVEIAWSFACRTNYEGADRIFDEILPLSKENLPNAVNLLLARGNLRIHAGRWKEAAADYSRAIEIELHAGYGDHWSYFQLSPLLIESGDLVAYRNNCQAMFARFGSTNNARVQERIAKAVLLLPVVGANLATASALADRAVSTGTNDALATWLQVTKGLAEFRKGNYLSAIRWTEGSLNDPIGEDRAVDYRHVQAYAIRAMACHQLMQTNEAHIALAKSVQIANRTQPAIRTVIVADDFQRHVNFEDYWHDWLIGNILLREAKSLIDGPAELETRK